LNTRLSAFRFPFFVLPLVLTFVIASEAKQSSTVAQHFGH